MPALLRTRLIGYAWDATAPARTMERSRKTSLVTFFILRSGPAELGRFMVERRNVRDDYARAFGEEPSSSGVVAISPCYGLGGGSTTTLWSTPRYRWAARWRSAAVIARTSAV